MLFRKPIVFSAPLLLALLAEAHTLGHHGELPRGLETEMDGATLPVVDDGTASHDHQDHDHGEHDHEQHDAEENQSEPAAIIDPQDELERLNDECHCHDEIVHCQTEADESSCHCHGDYLACDHTMPPEFFLTENDVNIESSSASNGSYEKSWRILAGSVLAYNTFGF